MARCTEPLDFVWSNRGVIMNNMMMALMASKPGIMSVPWDFLFWADKVPGNNGDHITVWEELIGGYDAPSATATDAVLTKNISAINGHSAIAFDGTQAYRNASLAMGQPRTWVIVFSVENLGRDHYIMDGLDGTDRNNIAWRNTNPDAMRLTSDGANAIGYNKDLASGFIMITGVFNGSNSKLYENGVLKVTGNAGTHSIAGITIGSSFNLNASVSLIGNVALCGGFNNEPAGSELDRMQQIVLNYYKIAA